MKHRTPASPPDDAAASDTDPLSGVQSAREAALALGVSERTIRRAIQRGELAATKRAGIFHITPSALETYRQHEAERRMKSAAAAQAVHVEATDTDQSFAAAADTGQENGDAVGVLRDLLAEERARSDRLLEAATLWQARAMQLEERVKALEAGPVLQPDAAVDANEGPGRVMPAATTGDASRSEPSRWGRFWRALTGR
jgi:excisionase family DNA binding protein